ncbi:MAG: hypothetical protein V2B18_05995 [Pseudomonadota bacterium]
MNDCEYISERFLEFHDGKLDSAAEDGLHGHLRSCSSCRDDFKWYGLTVQALKSLDDKAPPKDFLKQLNARLDSVDSPSLLDYLRNLFTAFPAMPAPVGLAAMLCVGVVGFTLYTRIYDERLSAVAVRPVAQEDRVAGAPADGSAQYAPTEGARPKGLGLKHAATSSPTLPTARIPSQSFSDNLPRHSITTAGTASNPTAADVVGADNLTVESARVEEAVESIKHLLPNLKGKVVTENHRSGMSERVLSVMIPPNAYPNLTSALINHGSVEVGAGADAAPPERQGKDGDSVVLRIRFVRQGE